MLPKVEILLQQKRYTEAENLLKNLLPTDPNNIHLLTLLAEVYIQTEQYDLADSLIDNAIGLAPDEPNLFYHKARIAWRKRKLDEAEILLKEAIALDPLDAQFFARLANIQLGRKKYELALETANKALSLDAENLLALNTKSFSLNRLNRTEESRTTIEGALREDPNNSYTHANYGFGLLEQGNYKKAMEHFKEALKNDPSSELAQLGVKEALKAKYLIYRLFMMFAIRMGNLTAKYQWGVILGLYFGTKFLSKLAYSNEALKPFLLPIVFLLIAFAFSTWIINPVSNLFLRFNSYGKLLLDKKEILSSNLVALALIVCLTGIAGLLMLKDQRFMGLAFFGLTMMMPLSVIFSPLKYSNAVKIYITALAAIGIAAIANTFVTNEILNPISTVYLFGIVGFMWGYNFLAIKEDNE